MAKVSLIIPTFNRPDYLRRLLSYYNSFNEKFDIIVADSSSNNNKKINKEIVVAFPDLNILYLDSYPETINPWLKNTDSIEHVQSKYCVLCADDDFITPKGIKMSVDFLEKNPDFIVAHGRDIGFRLTDGIRKKQQFRWRWADPPVSIELSEPAARTEYHLSNFFASTYYGVHRRDDVLMVHKEVLKFNVDLFLFGELLASVLTLLYGKMRCLDVLYGVRSEQTISNWPTLRDAIEHGSFDRQYTRFKDCLSAHLMEKARLGPKEAGDLVDKAMSAYLNKHMMKPVVPIPKTKKRVLFDSLNLPLWTQNGIIASYALANKVATVKTKSLYDALLGKPIFSLIKNRDDFKKIRLHILSELGTK